MKQTFQFLGLMMIALIATLFTSNNITYAYSLDELGSSIENPDWFDNQQGRCNDNTGLRLSVIPIELETNVRSIYFDTTHKSFQVLARRYNPKKKIDKANKDMKWSVVDERICTVDGNGLVKAGPMTGATIVILDDEKCSVAIFVVNRTGKYDKWYEDMFLDIGRLGGWYVRDEFRDPTDATRACEIVGEAYKIIVDAYLTYGNALRTDHEVRFKTIKEASVKVCEVAELKNKTNSMWGDCETFSTYTYLIVQPFVTNESGQRFGCNYYIKNIRHQSAVMLLDGTIYDVDHGNFKEVGKESQWKSSKNSISGTITWTDRKMNVTISFKKHGNFTDEHDYIDAKMK